MKNHEGYYDPTAAIAVLRAERKEQEKPELHLYYMLREALGFTEAVEQIKG